MAYSKEELIRLSITLPITQTIIERAEQFAAQHPEHLRERTRLNTLAVLVTNNYLYMQGYETNLSTPKRWNAASRLWEDTADLEIIRLGCLECRPIKVNQSSCLLPADVWSNRIGYLLVQINEENKQAKLLGFVPPFHLDNPLENLSVANLLSMDDFIDHLYQLESTPTPISIETNWIKAQIQANYNEETLKRIWKELKIPVLLEQLKFPPSFGHSIGGFRSISHIEDMKKREEQWNFYLRQQESFPAVLVVWLKPNIQDYDLLVQIYANEERTCLPEGVQLSLFSEEECLEQICSKGGEKSDKWIQSDVYTVEWGECIKIEITYRNIQFVQNLQDFIT